MKPPSETLMGECIHGTITRVYSTAGRAMWQCVQCTTPFVTEANAKALRDVERDRQLELGPPCGPLTAEECAELLRILFEEEVVGRADGQCLVCNAWEMGSESMVHGRDCDYARWMRRLGGEAETLRQLDNAHGYANVLEEQRNRRRFDVTYRRDHGMPLLGNSIMDAVRAVVGSEVQALNELEERRLQSMMLTSGINPYAQFEPRYHQAVPPLTPQNGVGYFGVGNHPLGEPDPRTPTERLLASGVASDVDVSEATNHRRVVQLNQPISYRQRGYGPGSQTVIGPCLVDRVFLDEMLTASEELGHPFPEPALHEAMGNDFPVRTQQAPGTNVQRLLREGAVAMGSQRGLVRILRPIYLRRRFMYGEQIFSSGEVYVDLLNEATDVR